MLTCFLISKFLMSQLFFFWSETRATLAGTHTVTFLQPTFYEANLLYESSAVVLTHWCFATVTMSALTRSVSSTLVWLGPKHFCRGCGPYINGNNSTKLPPIFYKLWLFSKPDIFNFQICSSSLSVPSKLSCLFSFFFNIFKSVHIFLLCLCPHSI